jgi:hypothetical protein
MNVQGSNKCYNDDFITQNAAVKIATNNSKAQKLVPCYYL